ncbi:MAG: arginase [Burkholderiales bacterium PBB5]|nr:MAG: arginase [Burkholderiales bacterium PBB5]
MPYPTISLIGAPTDIGAGSRGASMGPEALRVAGLQAVLEGHGLTVHDRGNLAGPANPWLPPVDGYRHLAEVVAWNQAVHDAMLAELRGGHLPILLGGDHCLGLGSISAVARHCREVGKKLRVLWLDAHADFNTNVLTPSGNVHGMPVASLATLDAQTHLHVSFDVDFLDPDIAPGVGTTVRGGPTYREAQLCMEMIADTGRLASLDVMELNPALDVRNQTAELAVDLIESLFGKSTLMRA